MSIDASGADHARQDHIPTDQQIDDLATLLRWAVRDLFDSGRVREAALRRPALYTPILQDLIAHAQRCAFDARTAR